MNSNHLTKDLDKFQTWCRQLGCIICKEEYPQLHHIQGAKRPLKGVERFGEKYVLPLCYWHHGDGCNEHARHSNKAAFVRYHCMTEKDMWIELMEIYKNEKGEYPFSEEEIEIIKERA
jgi:hypothetical protein